MPAVKGGGQKAKFQENEKVLCFHGPLLYEAKCLKVEMNSGAYQYFMHYAGWNSKWDEWVSDVRIVKHNQQGLAKQTELIKIHGASAGRKRGPGSAGPPSRAPSRAGSVGSSTRENSPVPASSTSSSKTSAKDKKEQDASTPSTSLTEGDLKSKKRTRVDDTVESQQAYQRKIEVKIELPPELKPWLVDDWDLVTKQSKLAALPARKSVEEILEEYQKLKLEDLGEEQTPDQIREFVSGLTDYFNVMLGNQLLYKVERPQYADQLEAHPENKHNMVQIYGAIHLLRLFVKLGNMLAYTYLNADDMRLVVILVNDFLRWMAKEAGGLFSLADYVAATPEYQRRLCV